MFGRYFVAAAVIVLIFNTGFKQSVNAETAGTDHQLVAVRKPATATSDPIVIMETSKGTVKIQVYRKDAPITAGNFLTLVQRGFYKGLNFFRYEPGFIIQSGDPRGDGTGCYIDPQTHTERQIPLEINPGLRHSEPGILAMAHTSDPNSASSQFYITLAAAPKLDGEYAVFGKVIDGLPVIMSLRANDKILSTEVKEPTGKAL